MDRYQDFDAWKLAHALNKKIFAMTTTSPAAEDFKFATNIRDAAASAERNFPEGFGRFGPREFARFLDHSRASLLETKNELQVGLQRGYFSEKDVRQATSLTNRALGALSGLQRYLRSKRAEQNARLIRERLQQEVDAALSDTPPPVPPGKACRSDSLTNQTPEPPKQEPSNHEPTNLRTHEPTNRSPSN
jgi:four helix bundle protein